MSSVFVEISDDAFKTEGQPLKLAERRGFHHLPERSRASQGIVAFGLSPVQAQAHHLQLFPDVRVRTG